MKDAIWFLKHLARTAAIFAVAWGIFAHFPLLYSEFAEIWHSPRTWLMRKIDRVPDVQLRYAISAHLPGLYRLTWICRLVDGEKTVAVLLPGATVETRSKPFSIRCGEVTAAQVNSNSKVEISRNSWGEPMLVLLGGQLTHSRDPRQDVDFRIGEWRVDLPAQKSPMYLELQRNPEARFNYMRTNPVTEPFQLHEPPFAAFKAEGLLIDGAGQKQVEFVRPFGPAALDLHRVSFAAHPEPS